MAQDQCERLVVAGLITSEQLQAIRHCQQEKSLGPVAAAESLGFAPARVMAKVLWPDLPFLNLDKVESLGARFRALWPPWLAHRHGILPVSHSAGVAMVGMVDPEDAVAIEAFHKHTELVPSACPVSFLALSNALLRIYGPAAEALEPVPGAGLQSKSNHPIQPDPRPVYKVKFPLAPKAPEPPPPPRLEPPPEGWSATEWDQAGHVWWELGRSSRDRLKEALVEPTQQGVLQGGSAELLTRLYDTLGDLYGYKTGDVMCYMPGLREDTPKGRLLGDLSSRMEECKSTLLNQTGLLGKLSEHLEASTATRLREHVAQQITLYLALEDLAKRLHDLAGKEPEPALLLELGQDLDALLQNPPPSDEIATEAADLIVAWRPHL